MRNQNKVLSLSKISNSANLKKIIEMYKIIRLEMQNELCQWVEVYKDNVYQSRLLVGKNQTDKEIVSEMFNNWEISKMF